MRLAPLVAALAALSPALALAQQDHRFHREGVLGTSMTLVVRAADADAAARAEEVALDEIARLEGVLSHYAVDSELRRFAATTAETDVSPDLLAALASCDRWRGVSDGAFEPGVVLLTALWQDADGREPDRAALDATVARLRAPHWRLDAERGTATRLDDVPIDLDGLAKGFILDRVCEHVFATVDGVRAVLLDVGGDIRTLGAAERVIGIADPRAPADNAAPLCHVRIDAGAIASSGGYARGFEVDGRHLSHILDPRTGRPVEGVLGATVVAADATTADALATILNVLDPAAGIALVERTPGAACVVVARDGTLHPSRGWDALVDPDSPKAPAADGAWPAGVELTVDLELANPAAGGRGRGGRGGRGGAKRPAVAVWIEDAHGEPVRTLCLWIERPRWLSDLRRWSRLNADRDGFVDAVSRAARRPGAYTLTWDGLDDGGHPVPLGDYVVLLEAAREHGTYQLMRQPVTLGAEAFERELDGNVEISAAHVRWATRPPESGR